MTWYSLPASCKTDRQAAANDQSISSIHASRRIPWRALHSKKETLETKGMLDALTSALRQSGPAASNNNLALLPVTRRRITHMSLAS